MKLTKPKILTFPLRLALIVLIFGATFKIMHWPYAKELMFTGAITISILYTIRFLNKDNKSQLDYVKIALVLLWVFSYLVKAFHLFNLPYVFEVCLLALFVWWFIKEGLSYFKNRKFKRKGIVKIIHYIHVGIASFCILFGIIFKIQHWPYGSELFVLGILILCVFLIVDYFLVERSS